MRKYLILIFISFQFNSITGQTIQQIDSVSLKMCESLSTLKDIKDDVKITMIFQKHLPDFYEKSNITSQAVADSVKDKVYFRLQKNCKDFREVLAKLAENNSDWITLPKKPKSKVSKKEFSTLFKGGNFYYKEYDNGKIVNVLITQNNWVEIFEDNTYSKLLIHPKDNGEFDLEFVESNHIRKNLSVKGDMYTYGLYEVNDGIFSIWISQSDKAIYGFRLYPK